MKRALMLLVGRQERRRTFGRHCLGESVLALTISVTGLHSTGTTWCRCLGARQFGGMPKSLCATTMKWNDISNYTSAVCVRKTYSTETNN